MKSILTLAAALALAGCAALPNSDSRQLLRYQLHDNTYAGWVDYATATVSLRAKRLEPGSMLMESLTKACKSRKHVEVLLWIGAANTAQSLQGSCVRVFLTTAPEVQYGPDVLLVDGDSLIIQGNLQDVRGRAAINEYRAQEMAKRNAQRLN